MAVSTMFYAGFVKRNGEVEKRRGQEIRISEDQDEGHQGIRRSG